MANYLTTPTGHTRLTLMDRIAGIGGIDAYTKLLLHGNGPTITDSAPSPKTITGVGGAALDTSQKKFGASSIHLSAGGDYLTVPDSADWDFGTGDFTVDAWVCLHSAVPTGYFEMLMCQTVSIYFGVLRIDASHQGLVSSGVVGTYYFEIGIGALPLDTWHHVALTRAAGVCYAFLDGVQKGGGQSAAGAWGNGADVMRVGAYTSAGYNWIGWIDELRVSKGIARWTAGFTPAASEYVTPTLTYGGGPILSVNQATAKRALSQIGSFTFQMPATDPMAQYINQGVYVQVNHRTLGDLGTYIIHSRRLNSTQAMLQVDCWALMRELTYFNCYLRRRYYDLAVSKILSSDLISGFLYGLLNGTGWTTATLDGDLGNLTIAFNGQSIFQAMDAMATRLNRHFREGTTPRTFDFGTLGADSGYRLENVPLVTTGILDNQTIGYIIELTEQTDPEEVVNKIIPLGGGQGDTQVTLQWCNLIETYSPTLFINPDGSYGWYLRDAASVATYGERTRVLPFINITPLPGVGIDTWTVLMLHCDGSNGSALFTDSAITPKTITPYGNAVTDTSAPVFGSAAMHLAATGDYLTTPDHDDFDFGAGDFSIDLWFKPAEQPPTNHGFMFLSQGNLFFSYFQDVSNGFHLRLGGDDGTHSVSITALPLNTWAHLAVVRLGTIVRFFIDGTQVGGDQACASGSWCAGTGTVHIGNAQAGGENAIGWLDELRVSKGIARWIIDFDPPTAAYTSAANENQNAANALYRAACSWLIMHKDEHLVFGVKAINVPAGLRVGDKVRVVYRGVVTRQGAHYKWIDLNTLFYVMERTDDIGPTWATTLLVLSNLGREQTNDTELLVGALEQIQIGETTVQPSLNRDSFVYTEAISTSNSPKIPIWIDGKVLSLNECKLLVQTRPAVGPVYPTTVSIKVDGVDKTSILGGPWAPGGGEIANLELDLTAILNTGQVRMTHTVEFSCASSSGTIVVTVTMRETTQA